MTPRFEIKYVSPDSAQAYVIAFKVDGPDFYVGKNARLAGAPVVPWDENIDEAPHPDPSTQAVFAFALRDPKDLVRFSVSQLVTLEGAQPAAGA